MHAMPKIMFCNSTDLPLPVEPAISVSGEFSGGIFRGLTFTSRLSLIFQITRTSQPTYQSALRSETASSIFPHFSHPPGIMPNLVHVSSSLGPMPVSIVQNIPMVPDVQGPIGPKLGENLLYFTGFFGESTTSVFVIVFVASQKVVRVQKTDVFVIHWENEPFLLF